MKRSFMVAWFLTAVVLVPSCKPSVAVSPETPSSKKDRPVESSTAYANYRRWHKANPKPARMSDVVAWMCRSLAPDEAAKIRSELKSPYEVAQEWKTFTVFVNDFGRDRLLKRIDGRFPVGTIIVKEKHDRDDSSTSELLTVMVKREAGFAPDIGDWEFLVLEGFAKAVQKSNVETCISCHKEAKANDYVFADYLPKS